MCFLFCLYLSVPHHHCFILILNDIFRLEMRTSNRLIGASTSPLACVCERGAIGCRLGRRCRPAAWWLRCGTWRASRQTKLPTPGCSRWCAAPPWRTGQHKQPPLVRCPAFYHATPPRDTLLGTLITDTKFPEIWSNSAVIRVGGGVETLRDKQCS